MLRLKQGVRLANLQPQVVLALQVAEGVYRDVAGVDCWMTSGNDGQHRRGSLHFSGNAADLRVHNIPGDTVAREVASTLREALGEDFDVVLEALGTMNAHIHLEYQPKER